MASDNVTVISGATNTTVEWVPAGNGPYGVAVDGLNGFVYVTNTNGRANATLSIINGTTNTVAKTIPIGDNPMGLAVDDRNGDVYVADDEGSNVQVVNGTTNTIVTVIGISAPPLHAAVDEANGYIYVTDTNNITVINGSTNQIAGYIPSSGGLTGPEEVAVDTHNALLYATETSEVNYRYYVAVILPTEVSGPVFASVSITPGSISLAEGGSENFTAAPYCTGDPCPIGATYSWALNNSLGTLNVSSGPQVLFTASSTPGPVSLTVTADLNGRIRTNSSAITITKSSPPSSTYTVRFTESGLPSGTSWSVTFNGAPGTSSTSSIVFNNLLNNTTGYAFTVGTVAGFTPSPSSGFIVVNGANVTEPVTFTAIPAGSYPVTFTETGLPTGANWSVTVGTTTHSSTASTISFTEVNGTYHYTVGSITGYTSSPSSGSLTVAGKSVSESVAFSRSQPPPVVGKYAVTFTESGLPSGTSWSVTLSASTQSSTTTEMTFLEANGTYSYTVRVPTRYSASPASGTVTVNGDTPGMVSVSFTKTSTGFLGLPGSEGYILIGVVVAVVAVAAALLLMRKRSPPAPATEEPKADNVPAANPIGTGPQSNEM